MSSAMERFERRLNRKAEGTQRNYLDAFNKFLEWAGIDHEELYRIQHAAELGMMNGDVEPWKANEAANLVADYMAKMVSEGYSASHAKQAYKAVRLFMRASGLKYFELDRDEKPQGYSAGQAAATPEQIRGLHDACHGQFKLRNQALILFEKDSGLRIGDASARTVEEYIEAKRKAPEPGFAVFEPVETEKEGVYAYPHVGPEGVEALDRYLGDRSSGPLFLGLVKEGRRGETAGLGPMEPDSISVQLLRLSEHLPNGGKRISAHSLRKTHRTRLEGAGMPEAWVKKLQGKKTDPYTRPEEDLSEKYPGASKLTERYLQCYGALRVFGEGTATERIKELQARLDKYEEREKEITALARRLEELEKRFPQSGNL